MVDVLGLYFLAALTTESRARSSATLGSGNAWSNNNDSRTNSIASLRTTQITGRCEDKFTLFRDDITNSVSEGHVSGAIATLGLAGAVLCWRGVSFLTVPPVCALSVTVMPEVLAGTVLCWHGTSFPTVPPVC